MRKVSSSETAAAEVVIERLKMVVAYDGRPFAGWQSQANRQGVQDFLEAAFRKITNQEIRVHGSGRTDAGVHALGQVAHADVPRVILETRTWRNALNAHLPAEIRVLRVSRAATGQDGFHARFEALGKQYLYRIWNAPWLHPLEIGRVWHVPNQLDFEALRRSAARVCGEHDFAGFAARRYPGETPDTVRCLAAIRIHRRGALLTLRFEGDGFLYKMVRLLTGTIIRVAQGRADETFLDELLAKRGALKTHFCAPADGLYLTKVSYARRR